MTNINDITKIIRQQLITQSGVNPNFIRDATSEYGSILDKNISKSIFETVTPLDTIILFELKSRDSASNMSRTNEDGSITLVTSYVLNLILYGDNSSNISNLIVARFRTENVRLALQSSEIYLEKISDPELFNEIKNNVVWQRNDIHIDISCELTITAITPDYEDKILNGLNIIRRS